MEQRPSQHTEAHPTTVLFVSLYMVVLSFFILLFSISNREESKAQQVTEAIQQSFRNILPVSGLNLSNQNGKEQKRLEFFDAIREGISTHIPLENARFMASGDFLYIRLPVAELFTAGKAQVKPEKDALFQFLAETTTRYQKQHRIHFTFYHPEMKHESALVHDRLVRIARHFENSGVPTSALSVGVYEGQPDILIVFHFHMQGNAS